MKFSIITCVRNSEKWLEKNIESARRQSYLDFEHIFIDGFSTDQTVALIKEYQKQYGEEKIKLFQLPPKGISNAMNEGVRKSSGDYLIHLHSDDSLFDGNALRDTNEFLSKNNFDWIYGKINVIGENGKSAGLFPTKKIWQNSSGSWFGKYLLKFYNYIPHQAVFIKKEVFNRFGYFDESLSSAMDPDLWLRIYKQTNWGFFNKVVSNFCLRSASQTGSPAARLTNISNFQTVQKRYLNPAEMLVARILYLIIRNW